MPIPLAALAIGGGLAAGGAIGDWFGKNADAERAAEAYDKIMEMSNQAMSTNQGNIDSYRNLISDTYGAGAANYGQALQNFLNSEVYQNQGFTYGDQPGQTIESFMDPAMNQRVDAAMNAINNSAASGGNRFSSDYINRVGSKQQSLASEEWEKAYNKLMQDRQMALNEYNINSQNNWNNYNAQQDRMKYGVDAYGRDRDAYIGGLGDAMSATIANRNANLQTQAEMLANKAQAQQGTDIGSLFGGIGGAGARFLTGMFGG